MSIDIEAILKAALAAGASAVQNTAPEAQALLKTIGKGHEKALKSLAKAYADGDIDEPTFRSEMADEARVLEAEMLAISVIVKAVAQRAINAFRKSFIDGITAALKAAL